MSSKKADSSDIRRPYIIEFHAAANTPLNKFKPYVFKLNRILAESEQELADWDHIQINDGIHDRTRAPGKRKTARSVFVLVNAEHEEVALTESLKLSFGRNVIRDIKLGRRRRFSDQPGAHPVFMIDLGKP
jgi:hypothetical protein